MSAGGPSEGAIQALLALVVSLTFLLVAVLAWAVSKAVHDLRPLWNWRGRGGAAHA